MPTILYCPPTLSSVGANGEEYVPDAEGKISVPDHLATVLMESHGLTLAYIQPPVAAKLVAPQSDDEMVPDDPDEVEAVEQVRPTPAEMVAMMTIDQMKLALKSAGQSIPRGIKVGDLRQLVLNLYIEEHAPRDPAPQPTSDGTQPAA